MPTYDYRCKACGHELEIFQSMSDAPKRKCPKCGKVALERLIGTGAAVLFKGSGFYQTDYRSDSYKKGAQTEKPADTKSDAKTDTKPEAKPDTKSNGKAGPESKPAADSAKPKPDKPRKKSSSD